uniref:Uncharacterized protein n=1 Tax=Anguilla anguilla TaxID=7936 RepID=A0A0E9QTB1_ANGAN
MTCSLSSLDQWLPIMEHKYFHSSWNAQLFLA